MKWFICVSLIELILFTTAFGGVYHKRYDYDSSEEYSPWGFSSYEDDSYETDSIGQSRSQPQNQGRRQGLITNQKPFVPLLNQNQQNPRQVPVQTQSSDQSAQGQSNNQVGQCIRVCPVTSEYNPVCGTDNITYNNMGRLLCAQYCGVAVSLARSTACSVPPPPSTPVVNPSTPSDLLRQANPVSDETITSSQASVAVDGTEISTVPTVTEGVEVITNNNSETTSTTPAAVAVDGTSLQTTPIPLESEVPSSSSEASNPSGLAEPANPIDIAVDGTIISNTTTSENNSGSVNLPSSVISEIFSDVAKPTAANP